jgi:hypothetical protein
MENFHVSQFVSRIISFSSEYSSTNWSASKIIGPPRLNKIFGDNPNSWCPAIHNENQILELGFEKSVYLRQIRIYENFSGGAVTRIDALNDNEYETVWSTNNPPVIKNHYDIFTPKFDPIDFSTNQIRIHLTLENRDEFTEIEAVEILGTIVNYHIPKKTLSYDMSEMLKNELFTDMKIECDEEVFKVHKCIIASRSLCLYSYLEKNDSKVKIMSPKELCLIIGFLYNDNLSETLLNDLIEIMKKKSKESNNEDSWMLTLNKLIRYAIIFKLSRLEHLLLNFMISKFLNLNNILEILMDSMNGETSQDSKLENDFEFRIKLKGVEEACMNVIRLNIKDVVKLDKLKSIPKSILLKIIQYI